MLFTGTSLLTIMKTAGLLMGIGYVVDSLFQNVVEDVKAVCPDLKTDKARRQYNSLELNKCDFDSAEEKELESTTEEEKLESTTENELAVKCEEKASITIEIKENIFKGRSSKEKNPKKNCIPIRQKPENELQSTTTSRTITRVTEEYLFVITAMVNRSPGNKKPTKKCYRSRNKSGKRGIATRKPLYQSNYDKIIKSLSKHAEKNKGTTKSNTKRVKRMFIH
ncbi:hypothetical protein ILUMI_23130 [Ignelater luminosus]|uniref:Uncharacterized protein n=1 Tax=Ignelater luminosus TaxID=2038154 RepID=A0A8K0CEH1_IGNLU|nr:hypothetical protein ILUMI_23130 [Ignelater luminosus]